MSVPRELLLRYLRQQAELGGGRIFLEHLSAAEALAAVAHLQVPANPGGAAAVAGPVPAAATLEQSVADVRYGPQAAPATESPDALSALQSAAQHCTGCRLHAGRRTVVFGEGSGMAEVVVVGEAPGQEEDRTGRPFVGRAGRLLDLMLMSAGFPREQVYICNVLKCRPPENRNPLPDEMDACTRHWLHGQLELIAPRVLLAVGKFAAQVLAASDESIGRLRGRIFSYRGTPLVVTYHPAYLLRSPQMTRIAWEDLQLLRKVLHEHA